MKKRDLIAFCRYYKGEAVNPYKTGRDPLFWEYERSWVNLTLDTVSSGIKSSERAFGSILDDYMAVKLGPFNRRDGVPITLKAVLFNRLGKWSCLSMLEFANEFKEIYAKEYLK